MVYASDIDDRPEPDDLDEMLAEVAADPEARGAHEDAMSRRELCARLVELRGEQRQRDVAARMRTTQSALSDLERGRVDPRMGMLQRYARAVGAHLQVTIGPDAA